MGWKPLAATLKDAGATSSATVWFCGWPVMATGSCSSGVAVTEKLSI